ncbi:F-box/kelch-repeat protein At3g23880-like [Arachis duranensis]|uniref:F-box/kelch-repeat protein At3g23880-like n=1 Tax=Arachis duranensis TaxID=130453 RepID=A0A6P4BGL4_ARADU|nr:F-box/kelch-repeat protein At3g23880-like [Arachis duranensis]
MRNHEYDLCNLPGDLFREILLRLPVKLLLQLKTVCRSWNSFISSHEFVIHHHQRSTQPRLVYCSLESEGLDIMQCSVSSLLYNQLQPTRIEPLHIKYKTIKGSCNGLLCLCEGFPYRTLTLFNPCTRSVSLNVPFEYPGGDYLQPVFCGLGYDALRDKYKFVTGSKSSTVAAGLYRYRAKVCTFDPNPSWKTVDHPMFPYFTSCYSGTFVSGTLNWMAHVPDKDDEWFILTFDLETESFGRLCLPRNNHTHTGSCYYAPSMQVLKNFLSMSFQPACDINTACTIWIMKEYGVEKSWTVLFTIPFGDAIFRSDIWLEPLYILEDEILLAYGKFHWSNLLVYNFRKGEVVHPIVEVEGSRDRSTICPLSTSVYEKFESIFEASYVFDIVDDYDKFNVLYHTMFKEYQKTLLCLKS